MVVTQSVRHAPLATNIYIIASRHCHVGRMSIAGGGSLSGRPLVKGGGLRARLASPLRPLLGGGEVSLVEKVLYTYSRRVKVGGRGTKL